MQPSKLELQKIFKLIAPQMEQAKHLAGSSLKKDISILHAVHGYASSAGGKRLRTAIVLLSAGMFDFQEPMVLEAANLVEQVHLATLLHDDVVDQAKVRRNQKTARLVFGDGASILTGDYLYASAFERLQQFDDPRIIWVLAKATRKMAEGELLQLNQNFDWESQTANEQQYQKIVLYKTAVLIGAAAEIGGILGSAKPEQTEQLKKFGNQIGVAFQMIDDVLDYQPEKNTGKQVGLDFKGHRVTLPWILLVFAANSKDFKQLQKIWVSEKIKDAQVQIVIELMQKYQVVTKVQSAAAEQASLAQQSLKKLPQNPYQQALHKMAEFVLQREY